MRFVIVSLVISCSMHSALGLVFDVPVSDTNSESPAAKETLPSLELAGSLKAPESVDKRRINHVLEKKEFDLWKHVGQVGMGSGIYLGEGYVLTSAHVGCFPFQMFDGSVYHPDHKTWHVVSEEHGVTSDLAIYKVKIPDPDSSLAKLGRLPISQKTPQTDSAVILLGTGLQQRPDPAVMKGGDKILAVLGYHTDNRRKTLAGTNTIDQVLDKPIGSGGHKTFCFSTRFDRGKLDAQASDGDSGGASFVYNREAGRWELAGCIIAVSQQDGFIPFGSKTFMADLTRYRNELPGAKAQLEEKSSMDFQTLIGLAPKNPASTDAPPATIGSINMPTIMGDDAMPM
ncbi:MAG: hypothetical protein ABF384_03380 [Verrucomicrobiales bacterium]